MLQISNFDNAPIAASGQKSTPSLSMPSLKGFQNFLEIVRRLGAARVRSERLGGMCGGVRPGAPGVGGRAGGDPGPVPGGAARGLGVGRAPSDRPVGGAKGLQDQTLIPLFRVTKSIDSRIRAQRKRTIAVACLYQTAQLKVNIVRLTYYHNIAKLNIYNIISKYNN